MTISNCHDLINTHYQEPLKREWTPSEYDMKYRFNTPRRVKKLQEVKAKEDAKLEAAWKKEHKVWEDAHHVVDEISEFPIEIQILFTSVFQNVVSYLTQVHNHYLETLESFKSKWSEDVFKATSELKYFYKQNSFYGRMKCTTIRSISDEEWTSYAKNHGFWDEKKRSYVHPLVEIKDWRGLIDDRVILDEEHDNDEVGLYGEDAYKAAIIHEASALERICEDLKKIFLNLSLLKCETDPHWGVGGHFNGILSDGIKKVSFCSFEAGGYNIQRYHFRFKITELKSK